jgi:hypothetical protein
VLHTYTSWWDTVDSMKEDIVRNVFVPRVWEHLVADHAAEWTQQTAPHIPGWRGKQLYKFIAEDPKLRALVGMSLSAAEPAEVVLDLDAAEPAEVVLDLDHEEMLRDVLLVEESRITEAISKRVATMGADGSGYDSAVEGTGDGNEDSGDDGGEDEEAEEAEGAEEEEEEEGGEGDEGDEGDEDEELTAEEEAKAAEEVLAGRSRSSRGRAGARGRTTTPASCSSISSGSNCS